MLRLFLFNDFYSDINQGKQDNHKTVKVIIGNIAIKKHRHQSFLKNTKEQICKGLHLSTSLFFDYILSELEKYSKCFGVFLEKYGRKMSHGCGSKNVLEGNIYFL